MATATRLKQAMVRQFKEIQLQILGEMFVKLLTRKSRISPLNQLIIPKLELCAAVLPEKQELLKFTKLFLRSNVNVNKIILWPIL